ncbi:Membrane-bound lytic murein transglycosylase B [Thalassocella blandensis]|nr:Membrane-bound lytic murein transglycosylase B [Thalassocella blandensis]
MKKSVGHQRCIDVLGNPFKQPGAKVSANWMRPIAIRLTNFARAGLLSIATLVGGWSSFGYADYSQHPDAAAFIDKMVKEHNFTKEYVEGALRQAEKKQSILDAISRPAEKTLEWFDYRKIFLGESRINQGVQFWQENESTLRKAEKEFGVSASIIVAIIGVETRYGRHAGSYRVIDALSTLGFDYPPRASFFRSELEHFFLLTREQKQDLLALTGSYAGAMGYGQFISSSFRHYAVDFDGDEIADIWANPTDAIGSVANYFKSHKWQTGKPVATRARIAEGYDKEILNSKNKPDLSLAQLQQKGFTPAVEGYEASAEATPLMYVGEYGKEFWLGFNNFYVITRYNRSHLYAMAVWQLSEEIRMLYEKSLAEKTTS